MKLKSLMVFLVLTASMPAQPAPASVPDKSPERLYPVEKIRLIYKQSNPHLPPLAPMVGSVSFRLRKDGDTITAFPYPLAGSPAGQWLAEKSPAGDWTVKPIGISTPDLGLILPAGSRLGDSAIRLIAGAVVMRLNELGLAGVYVQPTPEEIDKRGTDLRSPGNETLTMEIWASEISQVRTVAKGSRLAGQATLMNPAHQRIENNSPLKAESTGPLDLFRQDWLSDYLRRLNRQPGRTVEASISTAAKQDADGNTVSDPGRVNLDYLVTEGKPWLVYGQLSNTGTEATGLLRERFGLVDNQVTNHDDIASLDYITSDFNQANAVFGSYDYPLIFPDKLRLKTYGSWGDFDATQPFLSGGTPSEFTGTSWTGGVDLTASPFALGSMAVDFVAGITFEHYNTDDVTLDRPGKVSLLTPHAGVHLTRDTAANKFFANLGWETNVDKVDPGTVLQLGRLDANGDYNMIRGDLAASTFLEPLIYGIAPGNSWQHSTLANEVALTLHGQYVLDRTRLIPQKEAAAGGFFSVRGYPESVAVGDDVYQGSLEYRFHLPRALQPSSELTDKNQPAAPPTFFGSPFNARPPRVYGQPDWDLIFRGFLDAGITKVDQQESTESGHTLLGAGVGFELQLRNNLNMRLDCGRALESVKNGINSSTGYIPSATDVRAGHTQVNFMVTFVW